MADLSSIKSALMLAMMLGPGVGFWVRKRRRQRAVSDYPEVAGRLGLTLRVPTGGGAIGTLTGSVQGVRVFVDPEERPRVVAYFETAPKVVLRSFIHEKRTPAGMVRVALASAFLNERIKDRYSAPEMVGPFADDTELEPAVQRLLDTVGVHLADFSITDERVEVALDYGKPPHVPAEDVERLLPVTVEIARVVAQIAARSPAPEPSDPELAPPD